MVLAGQRIPVACTLSTDDVPARVEEWRRLLAHVTVREPIEGGWRLTFGGSGVVRPASIATLMAAEQACCAFFGFALTVDERGMALEVRAPDDALEIVEALFG
ncbi:MAG: hypothetical protein ACRD2W_00285 [Acidimicrobiales bacterium]